MAMEASNHLEHLRQLGQESASDFAKAFPSQRLLVSIPDAMWQLSISRTRLYELLSCGDLVAVKVGSRTLVTQQSITVFVDRLTAEAVTA